MNVTNVKVLPFAISAEAVSLMTSLPADQSKVFADALMAAYEAGKGAIVKGRHDHES